ncbi:hypothetical protein [Marinigracilibium pacificum]|uniref:Uncharacterized protein n=1 Tax=Marinigracilibium pacificum TaxID=2729599 RepID=A0A848ITS6_9BACT|nr:hypothetical protein [Marinigracilibium pacificum]NMM47893.1 hypothetical protein [Marinigracilibium pacificum]
MKIINSSFFTLLIFTLLFVSKVKSQSGIQKVQFGSIYTDNNTYYLYGDKPLNKKVYLVSLDNGSFISTKTTKRKIINDEVFETINVTCLDLPENTDISLYDLAVFSDNEDFSFKLLPINIIENKEIEAEVRNQIKNQNFNYLMRYYKVSNSHEFDSLKLEQLTINGAPTVIATQYKDQYNFGPRYLYSGDQLTVLNNQCASSNLTAFIINGNTLLRSINYCCQCGEIIELIHKIEGNNISIEYIDGSQSM